MDLTEAFAATVRVLRRRPTDLLPFYALGAAAPSISRVVSLLGLVAVYAYLGATGRLADARALLTDRELAPPDPETDPAAFEAWALELEPVVAALFDPVAAAMLAAAILASLLLLFLLYGAVVAGQYGACAARMRSDRGLVGGIRAARRHWLGVVGLYALEGAVWIAATLAAGLAVAVAALEGVAVALLVGLVAGLGWLIVVLATRAVFAFAPVALVVDDATAFGSLRASIGFIRANPVEALGYYVVAIGAAFGLSSLAGVLTVVGAASLVGLVGLLLVSPALDLLKTGLFVGHRGAAAPPRSPEIGVAAQARNGLGRGWRELGAFVRETPVLHALSAAIAAFGLVLGWTVAEPFVGTVETSIDRRLAGHVPPAAAVDFFANNWTVAIATGFAGIALAVPAATALWFNGLVVGFYGRTEANLVELVLFVLPHGAFEVPALIVAGAVGLWLGAVGYRAWRGAITRREFADALERAFWVLVGAGLLLAVAAVIEGFVSPYYYRPFL